MIWDQENVEPNTDYDFNALPCQEEIQEKAIDFDIDEEALGE